MKLKRVELKLIKAAQDSSDLLESNNYFPYQGKAKAIDELNNAIKEGVLEQYGNHSTPSPSQDVEPRS